MSAENPDFANPTLTGLRHTNLLYYECNEVVRANRKRWWPSGSISILRALDANLPDVIGRHFTELDYGSDTVSILHSVDLKISTQGWRNRQTRKRAHIRKPVIDIIFERNRHLYNPRENQIGATVLTSAVRYVCYDKKSTIGRQTAVIAHAETLKDCVGLANTHDPVLLDAITPYWDAYKNSDDLIGVKRFDFFNIDEPQPLNPVAIDEFQAVISAIGTICGSPQELN